MVREHIWNMMFSRSGTHQGIYVWSGKNLNGLWTVLNFRKLKVNVSGSLQKIYLFYWKGKDILSRRYPCTERVISSLGATLTGKCLVQRSWFFPFLRAKPNFQPIPLAVLNWSFINFWILDRVKNLESFRAKNNNSNKRGGGERGWISKFRDFWSAG